MTPVLSLSDAITAVEQSQTAFTTAATTTNNDQLLVTQAQAKLTAAQAQVSVDQSAQDTAAATFNAALDSLIATATASKIPTSTPPVVPGS